MVPSIEDQIHQFHIEREEARCRAIEAEYDERPSTKGQKVTRRKIPKPWKRPGANALCQETDFLVMVDEYDYDFASTDFQEYCLGRGTLSVAGEVGSRRWDYFLDYSITKGDYLEDPLHQYAEEVDRKQHRYTAHEMENGWTIICIGRAKLQDCWELFCKNDPDQRR